jgi:hypothetical protein
MRGSGMRGLWQIAATAAAVVGALALLVWAGRGILERRALYQEMERLRSDVLSLRAEVGLCQAELDTARLEFQAYNERVDSLRTEVREMEDLDVRGVPAPRYDDYLDAFDGYNRSIPGWQERADGLESRWEECRDLVQNHNVLADSLRRRVGAPPL